MQQNETTSITPKNDKAGTKSGSTTPGSIATAGSLTPKDKSGSATPVSTSPTPREEDTTSQRGTPAPTTTRVAGRIGDVAGVEVYINTIESSSYQSHDGKKENASSLYDASFYQMPPGPIVSRDVHAEFANKLPSTPAPSDINFDYAQNENPAPGIRMNAKKSTGVDLQDHPDWNTRSEQTSKTSSRRGSRRISVLSVTRPDLHNASMQGASAGLLPRLSLAIPGQEYTPTLEDPVAPTDYMMWALLSAILFPCTGFKAVMYAQEARRYAENGFYEMARDSSHKALNWTLFSIFFPFFVVIIVFFSLYLAGITI